MQYACITRGGGNWQYACLSDVPASWINGQIYAPPKGTAIMRATVARGTAAMIQVTALYSVQRLVVSRSTYVPVKTTALPAAHLKARHKRLFPRGLPGTEPLRLTACRPTAEDSAPKRPTERESERERTEEEDMAVFTLRTLGGVDSLRWRK